MLAALAALGVTLLASSVLEPRVGTAEIVFLALLPLGWVCVLAANCAYDRRFRTRWLTEVERIARSFVQLAAIAIAACYFGGQGVNRLVVLVALTALAVADLLTRAAARVWRRAGHDDGRLPVLAIGSDDAVAGIARALQADRHAGLKIVGLCATTTTAAAGRSRDLASVPLVGDLDSVASAAATAGAAAVLVCSADVEAEQLRDISWQLENAGIHVIVAPEMPAFAAHRVHLDIAGDRCLVHVDTARFTGTRYVIKSVFDRVAAVALLVLVLPALVTIAALVKLTSRGPVFFVQTRVGRDGRLFRMAKFRSMHVGADQRVADLVELNDVGDGLLFKIRADPRVTRIGRVLRRYSLDELPQLFNVLTGSMSMVGPRPPLPEEVLRYADRVHRRLLVKPGLTGPWQVSGRSDLPWDESVRLDLNYVENWSLISDIVLLVRTARAVMCKEGAY